MAYLTYEEYKEMGGSAVSEQDFQQAERRARALMDDWTMGRVRAMQEAGDPVPECVKEAMCVAVDAVPGLSGERVSSFDNGVDSFTFDTSRDETGELYDAVCAMLPVRLVSRWAGDWPCA